MNSSTCRKHILIYIIFILFFLTKTNAQSLRSEICIYANTPTIINWDISKYAKNPWGVSITGNFFLTKRFAIAPSIRYDNFNYKPVDKRIANYAQFKVGPMYFDNFLANTLLKRFKVESYSVIDCGLGVKLNDEMIGGKNCFTYSVGYGIKKVRNKMIIESVYDWVNIKIANGTTASWLSYRLGIGYRLGK